MTAYIQPSEYAAFGIPDATAPQVEAASRMVDGELGRPEGLLWSPDANGEPGWMSGMSPTRTYTLADAVVGGDLLALTFPTARFGFQSIGDVVILDRADDTKAEACVISAAVGNTITLENVQFDHAAGATLEFGLVISEQGKIGRDSTIRVMRPPLARLLSLYGRPSDRWGSSLASYDELAWIANQPRSWGGFLLDRCDYDTNTGNVRMFPTDVLTESFTEARLSYVGGWSQANLPAIIKQVVANLVSTNGSLGAEGLSGNIKLLKSGDATIERFAGAGGGASLFDSTTLRMLAPFRTYRI